MPKRRGSRLTGLLLGGGLASLAAIAALAETALPAGMVRLRDLDATIIEDMRYGTPNNFTGAPLPGYGNLPCILRRDAAKALARVQRDLAGDGYALKVFDCYRPVQAVKAMADWASDGKPAGPARRYFPRLEKSRLFALGYIAARSTHSNGTAVDLTLVAHAQAEAASSPSDASCTAPLARRGPGDGIDMGTGFDCFDTLSHTGSAGIDADARRNRERLVNAMRRHGFDNYAREWWHFSYTGK